MDELINIIKSISDKTRLRILHLLIKSGRELCICEIVDSLQLPQPNISNHIRELKIAGLVKEKRNGKFILYFVDKLQDRFMENIKEAVNSAPEKYFIEDDKRLRKRLSLRINGKIVIGVRKG